MKHPFLPLALLVLLALLFSVSTPLARAADYCNEGDRRICGSDVGICRDGKSVCKDGNWTECNGEIRPYTNEICGNGLDDDCDGAVDEDCFPWISLVLVGVGMLFIGIGMYYIQKEKGERLMSEGVSKD